MSESEDKKDIDQSVIEKLKSSRSSYGGWLSRCVNQCDLLEATTSPAILEAYEKKLASQLNKLQLSHDKYLLHLRDNDIDEAEDWMERYFDIATKCLSNLHKKMKSSKSHSVPGTLEADPSSRPVQTKAEDVVAGSDPNASGTLSQPSLETASTSSLSINNEVTVEQVTDSSAPTQSHLQVSDSSNTTATQPSATLPPEMKMNSVMSELNPGASTFLPQRTPRNVAASAQVSEEVRSIDDWIDSLEIGVETQISQYSATTDLQQLIARLEVDRDLPKVELPVFDGSAIMWPRFIEQFFVQVHSRPGLMDCRRMDLLQSHVKGDAKRLIQGLGYSGRNYAQTLKELKFAFGHRIKVAQAYINSITNGNIINSGDSDALRSFYIAVRDCIITLQQMNYVNDLYSSDTLQRTLHRLPNDKRGRWNEYVCHICRTREPTLLDLLTWLKSRIEAEFSPFAVPVKSSRQHHTTSAPSMSPPSFTTLNSSAPRQTTRTELKECPACSGNHHLSRCEQYTSKSQKDKYDFVKNTKICFNCLYPRHRIADCTSSMSCDVKGCGKRHHTSLHRGESECSNDIVTSQVNNLQTRRVTVYFQVLPVIVRGQNGRSVKTFALLDSASDISLINSDLAKDLGLGGRQKQLTVNTLSSPVTLNSTCVSFFVQACDDLDAKPLCITGAWTRDGTFNCPPVHTSRIHHMSHLKDLNFANVEPHDVKILIGANAPKAHLQLDIREGQDTEPVAIRTSLGWCVMGVATADSSFAHSAHVNLASTSDDDLHRQVERFWQTESFGVTVSLKAPRSVEDLKSLKVLEEETHFVDGKYEVPMLWKDITLKLPNNRPVADSRFKTLQRRLASDQNLKDRYTTAMQTYIDKGYAQKLSPDEIHSANQVVWYLPHHSVVNPHKPEKIRVVFDAAAAYDGVSLNSSLLSGPDLLNSLFGVLQRFRTHPVAIVADITDMFYQVKVPQKDTHALRFLWKEEFDSSAPPDVYKMLVHIFGAKDSPCCANYALQRVALDNDKSQCLVNQTILKNFYMDDLLKSVDTVETAKSLAGDLREALSSKGFKLIKWMSSSKEFLSAIPEKDKSKPNMNLEFSDLPMERTLGIKWDIQADSFVFSPMVKLSKATKRNIVSTVTSIFDPCGFLAPYTFIAKCLIQDLWRAGVGWDEIISELHQTKWKDWSADLHHLNDLHIPRYHGIKSQDKIELHIFCDASELGFAASAYLRMIGVDIHCSFVAAKSHVAPVKSTLTIPKLELQGAVMAVRLSQTLLKELDVTVDRVVHWTDAMTVLKYIRNESRRWKIFVANRVSEIREKSDPSQWNYVPSATNPADLATRGLSAQHLKMDSMWFAGPTFLHLPESCWPEQPDVGSPSDEDENLRKNVLVSFESKEDNSAGRLLGCNIVQLVEIEKFSSWFHLKKRTAWIGRAVRNFAAGCSRLGIKGIKAPQLTIAELQEAEILLVKMAQEEVFDKDYRDLKKEKTIDGHSNLLPLNPFFDKALQIVRVGGRLRHSPNNVEAKHQILLPYKHHVTELIIDEEHNDLKHAGVEHVISSLRKKYWPIKCRLLVKQRLSRCFYCRIRSAKPKVPFMSDLPAQRVRSYCKPFEFTGVDYFGPMMVKRARSRLKKWGCIFTCLVTRAIHLELADSLESDDFILLLRSFIGRRGKPAHMYSDNGKNFVGATRELRECLENLNGSDTVQNFVQKSAIQWHFIPPNAPHFGGAWERLIKSTKSALKAILQEQCVTEAVLRTALIEVEDIINSRPLTYNSADPNDFSAITPNHFLRGESSFHIPPGSFDTSDKCSRKRWRQAQVLTDHLWKRWLEEYLPTLTVRRKWLKEERNHLVGDLVLLMEDNRPRGQWPLGRVLQVFPSQDGRVRSLEVKTAHGTYVRPTARVCLLEEAIGDS